MVIDTAPEGPPWSQRYTTSAGPFHGEFSNKNGALTLKNGEFSNKNDSLSMAKLWLNRI